MKFFNLWGFLGLLSIPIIIIMYLLKQKHKEVKIPSIMLWQKAVLLSEAQQPWQKLRKNLIMLLQLIAALLITFVLAKPYIIGIEQVNNYIFVLDSSMSMKTEEENSTRFETAKQKIYEMIENVEPNSTMSLIVAESQPYIAVNTTDSKSKVKSALNNLKVTDTSVDTELTKSILEAVYKENGGMIYVFSDMALELEKLPVKNILIGRSSENMAVTLVSSSQEGDGLSVLVKVRSYKNSVETQSVALYLDGIIYDTKEITIEANESKSVFFYDVPMTVSKIEARIENKDSLKADDVGYAVNSKGRTKKVLLLTEQNIFLEKALSLVGNIELYKAKEGQIEDFSGYDLYIFDGSIPENLPSDGHILVINPPDENNFIKVIGKTEIDEISTKDSSLLEFITDVDFAIAEAKSVEVPQWAEVIIESGDIPLILCGEENSQKKLVFTFDLHSTDLPLKKEFPIFVYNMLNWYLPENISKVENVMAGDILEFDLLPNAEKVRVIAPDGTVEVLAPPFPVSPFSNTKLSGIYTLEQTVMGKTYSTDFAVNISEEEANLFREQISQNIEVLQAGSERNKDIAVIFIILVLLILLIEWILYRKSRLYKHKIINVVRIAVVVILIFSLLGIEIKTTTKQTTTLFLTDISQSMKNNESSVIEFIQNSLEYKGDNDSVGLVSFGEYAVMDRQISDKIENIVFSQNIEGDFTDIEKALRLSSAVFPEDTLKRIVLISDGQENLGNALQQAKLLKENNIQIDVYPIKNNILSEVQVSEVSVPEYINKETNVNIGVKVNSLNNTQAILKLYKNNTIVAKENITIYKGENNYIFKDVSSEGGSVLYRAEVEAEEDTFKENNVAYAYSYVEEVPTVLIIDSDDSGSEMEKILMASNLAVARRSYASAPNKLEQLSAYDTIILADVSMNELGEERANLLETYVKTMGGGLIAVAGTNSFAVGGYQDTVLETILPVEMELEDKNKEPNLGMIIVMDRSGSMSSGDYGISKMSLAKEAVVRAVEAMSDKDSIGVITFDTEGEWSVPFQVIGGNKENIKNDVSSIISGGGTSILPSLQMAYEKLKDADTKLKHIILLTDGQAESSGYDGLIESMKESGITLSTVAVGSDSDRNLLIRLAESAGGRYYYSTVFTDLPEIFAKEAFLAGKEFINNREFYPVISANSSIMENVEKLPILGGYIASVAKSRADVVLKNDKDEPILATWQYGLGKSAAWLSDMDGEWSAQWLSSDEGVQIFKNMVSWSLKSQRSDDTTVKLNNSVIQAQINYNDIKKVKAAIITPDLKQYEVEMKASSPYIYETELEEKTEGTYIVNLQIERENAETVVVNSGVNINYSSEFDIRKFETGEVLLNKLAEATGGRFINLPQDIFENDIRTSYVKRDITLWFIIAALILFLIEIAMRRFPVICATIELTAEKIGGILINGTKKDENVNKNKKIKEKNLKDKKVKSDENKVQEVSNMSSTLLANKKKRSGR